MVYMVRTRSALAPRATTSSHAPLSDSTTLSSGQEMMKQFYQFQQFQEYLAWQRRQQKQMQNTPNDKQEQEQNITMTFEEWQRRNYPQSTSSAVEEPGPLSTSIDDNHNSQVLETKVWTRTTIHSFLPWTTSTPQQRETSSSERATETTDKTARDEPSTSSTVNSENHSKSNLLKSLLGQEESNRPEQSQTPESSTKNADGASVYENFAWLNILETISTRYHQIINQSSNNNEGKVDSTASSADNNDTDAAADIWNHVVAIWDIITNRIQRYTNNEISCLNHASGAQPTETSSTEVEAATVASPTSNDSLNKKLPNLGSAISDIAQSLISTCHATSSCSGNGLGDRNSAG